jgi:hypothetical protein
LSEGRAALAYYLAAGGLGLLFEWLVMGLSPWSNPNLLQIPFQLGMFSFWAAVAFAPRLLLDHRAGVSRLRKWCQRFLALGFLAIYAIAFAASPPARFPLTIAAVISTFILLNAFHFCYIRALIRKC